LALSDLTSTLHTDQLETETRGRSLPMRIARAIRREWTTGGIYGIQWGDPDVWTPLQFIRDRYVRPFVKPQHTALDIGCGGGRWTHQLLGFGTIYAVDYYEELLVNFRRSFGHYPHVRAIKNNGTDFPGIAPESIDYVLSFGCFGHINQGLIDQYLGNLKPVLRPGANVVIHYSDKTKVMAQGSGFSDNTPEQMRALVRSHGYRILEEDTTTMWNGALVHFTL
jgi:SAM-dependent methyltransferase